MKLKSNNVPVAHPEDVVRRAIAAHETEGLSYRKIARRLGVPASTVYDWISCRGRTSVAYIRESRP